MGEEGVGWSVEINYPSLVSVVHINQCSASVSLRSCQPRTMNASHPFPHLAACDLIEKDVDHRLGCANAHCSNVVRL